MAAPNTTRGPPVFPDSTLSGGQPEGDARYFGACLPLRVLGGVALAVAGDSLPPGGQAGAQAAILALFFAFLYSGCCHSRRGTWKNYARPPLALGGAFLAAACGRWDVAGTLIAADGLVGVQGRHTAALIARSLAEYA